jgi:hypothetical protein
MSKVLPTNLQVAAYASASPHALLEFLDIYHLDLPGDHYIHIVNNPVALTRLGVTYLPVHFTIVLPVDKDAQIGDAKLSMDAVDLVMIAAIRSITSRATIKIVVALGDQPDATPEVDLGTFDWKNVTYNRSTISGDLTCEDVLSTMVPSLVVSPTNVPGSF